MGHHAVVVGGLVRGHVVSEHRRRRAAHDAGDGRRDRHWDVVQVMVAVEVGAGRGRRDAGDEVLQAERRVGQGGLQAFHCLDARMSLGSLDVTDFRHGKRPGNSHCVELGGGNGECTGWSEKIWYLN